MFRSMHGVVIVLCILLCFTFSCQSSEKGQLNVLHIIIDDLRPTVGCYGDPIAKTPSIDKLAAKGVQFDRAYVQYPICGPSRASFLSGMRSQTTGYFDWEYSPGVTLMPTWFRQNGDFTAAFGKVFHQHSSLYIPEDEIHMLNPPGAWDVSDICITEDDPCGYGYLYSVTLREEDPRAAKHVLTRGSLRPEGLKGGWFWQEWSETDLPDEKTSDGVVVRRAVETMERALREGKPFYVAACLRRPHQVLAAPKKYFDLFPLSSIPVPPVESPDHLNKVPSLALNYDKSMAYNIYSNEGRRQLWRAYYANVSFVDAQVEFLLEALDRLDLWKNTVVVFHSDHGWQLGEHGGLGNKDVLFDESIRSPLIIAAPGFGESGHSCPHPVELVDIFPTLASLCKLESPGKLDGVSLQSLLENPLGAAPRDGAISVVIRQVDGVKGKGFSGIEMKLEKDAGPARQILGRALNTVEWCYTEWDDGKLGVELYDVVNDPLEQNNLANLNEYATVKAELHTLLRKLDHTTDKQLE